MSPGVAGHRIESTTYKQHIIRLSILFFLRGGYSDCPGRKSEAHRTHGVHESLKGLLSKVTAAVSSGWQGWLFGRVVLGQSRNSREAVLGTPLPCTGVDFLVLL